MRLREAAHGIAKGWKQPGHLAATTTRQHQKDRRIRRNAMALTEARSIAARRIAFDHRVPHIGGRQPDFLEIGWLEGQQSQQMISGSRRILGPEFTPGPDHGRNIMDDRRP